MGKTKLGTTELICVVLIVLLAHLILILPKLLLQSQGSGCLINITYVLAISILLVFILNKLYKKFPGMDILDISSYLFGNTFKIIIGIIFIAYFIFISSLLLRNTAENLRTMYFQTTPTPYLLFFLVITGTFANRFGIKNVIKCNVIVVALVLISLVALFILSSSGFSFTRIYPILGYGTKSIFVDGLVNISSFGNMIMIFFIMPLLKDPMKFKKVSYLSIILSGIFVLITIFSLLLIFPITISSGSNIPLYLQTRTITLGKLIQRVDAFFVLIWIFCILSYVSIIISFLCMMFKKISNIESTSRISYSFSAILFGICLYYRNLMQIRKLDTQGYKILPLIIGIGLTFTILIMANIKKKVKEKNEVNMIEQ